MNKIEIKSMALGSLITILILLIGHIAYSSIGHNKMDHSKHLAHNETMSMSEMMHDMNASLRGKKDDEFDKIFLEEMIIHHKGAVDMANLAFESTERKEILELSKAIVEAQEKEIADMQSWLELWFEK